MLSRFKKVDEEKGETPPSALLQKAVQTRLRPLMNNVRRSSLAGNTSTFSRGLLSASGVAALIVEGAASRNLPLTEIENNIEMVEIALDNQDKGKESATLSTPATFTTRGNPNHSTVAPNSAACLSGMVSASGFATSLILQSVATRTGNASEDNAEMEEIAAKNDEEISDENHSTTSPSATTSKGLYDQGNPKISPGASNSGALKRFVAAESDGLGQRRCASLNDIGIIEGVQEMNFPRRSSCNDIYDAAAVTTGLRDGEFVVTVIPATTRNARKIQAEDTRGVTEWCINYQYYMGLSPFKFDRKGRIVSTRLSKVAFLSVNVLAITYSLGQVRVLYDTMSHPGERYHAVDKVYWYIWIGYQLGATLLQFRYFTFMWFDKEKIQSMVKADRRCPLTTMKYAKQIAAALRIYSSVVSFACTVGGFGLIHSLKEWSVDMLLGLTEGNIYTGFLQDALNTNQSAPSPTSSAMYNATTISTTTFASIVNTTVAGTIESPVPIGWFIDDGNLETKIIGSIGLCMSFCYHSQISCASEVMTSSIITLWNGMKNLQLEKISGSQRKKQNGVEENGSENDSGSDEDVATEDEEYSDDLKELVFETKKKFRSLWQYATKSNTALKTFWPALALVALLMTTFILFAIAEKQYFDTIGFALLLIPIFVGFYLALKTAVMADDYQAWFSSDRAQAVFKSSVRDFQITFVQLFLQPLGYGTGLFYVNSVFLAGFLGAAITYFFTQTQSFHTETCKNN